MSIGKPMGDNNMDEKSVESISVERVLEILRSSGSAAGVGNAPQREITICGHMNPDGDALGSILALNALLTAMGHNVVNLLPTRSDAPALYDFFDNYNFTFAADYKKIPDLFIAVDSPNKIRLGDGVEVFDRAIDSLVIDHHPGYSGFGKHYFGDATASATGILVWEIVKASGLSVTENMANYCYVALMTDTGHFAFQNTNAQSFVAAGEMVVAGADPALSSSLVYDSRSIGALELDSRLISRISFAGNGKVVYSWVTQNDFEELQITRDETEGLPTILRSVQGTEIAILLREEKNRIRVNLRAKGHCDVGAFAKRFDGGGHKAAAGFTMYSTLSEAEELILREADSFFIAGTT